MTLPLTERAANVCKQITFTPLTADQICDEQCLHGHVEIDRQDLMYEDTGRPEARVRAHFIAEIAIPHEVILDADTTAETFTALIMERILSEIQRDIVPELIHDFDTYRAKLKGTHLPST